MPARSVTCTVNVYEPALAGRNEAPAAGVSAPPGERARNEGGGETNCQVYGPRALPPAALRVALYGVPVSAGASDVVRMESGSSGAMVKGSAFERPAEFEIESSAVPGVASSVAGTVTSTCAVPC